MWNIQGVMEFKEHNKRAWSVVFSHLESSMLVSGGDDHKVVLQKIASYFRSLFHFREFTFSLQKLANYF